VQCFKYLAEAVAGMLPARDPALFAAGALPVADPGKAPSAEDFSEALAKKLGRKGGDACGRFRKWLCSSSTCRGNGSGSGRGSGGGGGDQWNLPLTEEERVAFQAAYGEWSERRDRYEAWRASVQAAEVRLLLLLSTKTNTTTTTTTINRDNAGGATTRRAWLFWAPSVAAGVLATVPMVSGATVALFLPAFFLLLLVRTATVETDDKKFVKRQDKIVSETKAQHRLRIGRFLGRTLPMLAFCVAWPVCLVVAIIPRVPWAVGQALLALHLGLVLLLQLLGTVRATQSWLQNRDKALKEARKRKAEEKEEEEEESKQQFHTLYSQR
jgi:hypothetical protein